LEALRQVEKSRGITPPELANAPTLSTDHNSVWEAYTNLAEYTWSEIESYQRVTGHLLDGWEVEAVMTLARYRSSEPIWPLK